MPHIEGEHKGHKFNWVVSLRPDSYPISTERMTCTQCGGRCRPYFGMIDDPEDCWHCNNTGTVLKPIDWKPTPPPDLVEAIQKLVREYWNKQQNDNFKLTGD